MTVESDSNKLKFVEYIKVQVIGNGLINLEREQRILEKGISQFGLDLHDSRALLLAATRDQDIILQSDMESRMKDMAAYRLGEDGYVSRAQFNDIVGYIVKSSRGKLKRADAERQVKQMIRDAGVKPRRYGFFRSRLWWRSIKDD